MNLLTTHRDRAPEARGHLSILAGGVEFTGELACEGALKVEGRLEGFVRSADQVLVAPGGEIVGNVHAREVVVAGRLMGNVTADDRVDVRAGGIIEGDVTTPRVAIEEGAMLDGRLEVQPHPAPLVSAHPLRKTA
ncbi:MAG: polymer-forming cytoskeletal protein [Gemmatimonadota bacterium]|nr:polymer-forming cytoskeletal protein [Gemmatimonadota bacterium]